jgi:hypothetical protein
VAKIPLVKVLRRHASLSLTEATQAVDRCLGGEAVSLEIPSIPVAEALIRDVPSLGIQARLERAVTVRHHA